MTFVVVNEGEIACATEWQQKLHIGEEEFVFLKSLNFFEAQPNGGLRLTFVGFLVYLKHVVACAPKYWDKRRSPVNFLRRVLSSYFRRDTRVPIATELEQLHFQDDHAVRELDALFSLLEWLHDHGIYFRESLDRSVHSGRVDWPRTVARETPLISNSGAFYPNPFRITRSSVYNDTSRAQISITLYLAQKYGIVTPSNLAGAAASIATEDAPFSPAATSYFLPRLARERRTVYRTSHLTLISILESVLGAQRGLSGPTGVRLYGTRAFYAVWEDACRAWFHSLRAELTLAQPTWLLKSHNGLVRQPGFNEQRPDFILSLPPEFIVVDAKYYFPFPTSRPGWQDIVKQLYYAECLNLPPGSSFRNAFMFPLPGSPPLRFGGWTVVEDGPRAFPPIEIWLADPDDVFEDYGAALRTDTLAEGSVIQLSAEVAESILNTDR